MALVSDFVATVAIQTPTIFHLSITERKGGISRYGENEYNSFKIE